MTHWHIISANMSGMELANAVYATFTDSIVVFSEMAKEMYNAHDEESLQVNSLMEQSEYGQSPGLYFGLPALTLVWKSCEGNCESPVWN